MVSPTPGGRPALRYLGQQIRKARERKGMTLTELAKTMGTTTSTLSRIENGVVLAKTVNIQALLVIVGIKGSALKDALAFVEEMRQQPNWEATTEGPRLPQQLRTLVDYEQAAKREIYVSKTLLPGLIQTADYARAVFEQFGGAAKTIEDRLTIRLERQAVLEDGLELVVIIAEQALQVPIGGPAVAAAQWRRALEACEQFNVEVLVYPASKAGIAVLSSDFFVLEFSDVSPVAYVEHPVGGIILDQARPVRRLKEIAVTLRESSFGEAESVTLIERSIDTLENQ